MGKVLINLLGVLINLLGAGVFVLIGTAAWPDPRYDYPGSAGGLIIIVGFLQILTVAIFSLLNFSFIFWACFVYLESREWILRWIYLLVPVIWMITFWFNSIHRCIFG